MNRLNQPVEYIRGLLDPRKIAAGVAIFGLAASNASGAVLKRMEDSPREAPKALLDGAAASPAMFVNEVGGAPVKKVKSKKVAINFMRAFPGLGLSANNPGVYLKGTNKYDPNHSPEADLWFEATGNPNVPGEVNMYNTNPNVPNPGDPAELANIHCHADTFHTSAMGETYTETNDHCDPSHTKDTKFSSGVILFPQTSNVQYGVKNARNWSIKGSTPTAYYENGIEVCSGANTFTSKIVGLTKANGIPVVQTHTDEYQVYNAVPGAPASENCPANQPNKTYHYVENFYFSYGLGGLAVKAADGTTVGNEPGLVLSVGGNADYKTQTGHWEWFTKIDEWQQLPPPTPAPTPPPASTTNYLGNIEISHLLNIPINGTSTTA